MTPTARRTKLLAAALLAAAGLSAAAVTAAADDWPTWGRDASRNMVSAERFATPLPVTADAGEAKEDDPNAIDPATTKNVKWVAKLGTECYGNPAVAGGRVYAGTNNAVPRDPKHKGLNDVPVDFGVLMAFEEQTGKLLWQFLAPKLGGGAVVDAETVGLCSPPTIDGDRVYLVTNRCEVVCLDAKGLADGNDGPFKDEALYVAGPKKPPVELGAIDADILWRYDMRHEHGIFPQQMTSSAVLVVGDRLYVTTSNGVDWTGKHIPSPQAPALICLDKTTGKLLAEERSGISARTMYCNWSSPAYGTVGGKPTIVYGGGDGFCYGFDPEPVAGDGGAVPMLKELWRIDANLPEYRERNGKPVKYKESKGPSEIIATPVVHDDKVYVAIGQDPEYPEGAGVLNCIAVTGGKPDYAWRYPKIGRSMSTVAIADGVLYTAEGAGLIHVLDAKTGAVLWTHDTESHIFGSPLVADGKVYYGNEQGDLYAFAAAREKKELGKIEFGTQINASPVAANGVLYVATTQNLYALQTAPEAKK